MLGRGARRHGDHSRGTLASATWNRPGSVGWTPPYGTAREKVASSANGVDGPAPADADDDDLIGVVNLVDHAIDADPHTPVPFPLAPHGARTWVPWVLGELAKFAAGNGLGGVRQGVELVGRLIHNEEAERAAPQRQPSLFLTSS